MTLDDLLDRRVPLAMALALCLQAGGIVWWVSARDSSAHFQERRIDHLEEAANETRASQSDILQRLARIEERQTAEAELLQRIDQNLQRSRR